MSKKIEVTGKIHPIVPNRKPEVKGVFFMPDDFVLPFDLEDGHHYIITAWDTNCYILGVESNPLGYETFDLYGERLEAGKEYMLLKPAF